MQKYVKMVSNIFQKSIKSFGLMEAMGTFTCIWDHFGHFFGGARTNVGGGDHTPSHPRSYVPDLVI